MLKTIRNTKVSKLEAEGYYPLFAGPDTVMVRPGSPIIYLGDPGITTHKIQAVSDDLNELETFLLNVLRIMGSESDGNIVTGKNHLEEGTCLQVDRILASLRDKGYLRYKSFSRTVIVLEPKTLALFRNVELVAA